jgi:hypothetical protein
MAQLAIAQTGYIATDSSLVNNLNFIPGNSINNAHVVLVKEDNGAIVRYSPHDIDEYGLDNGKVYFAKDVLIEGEESRVFLQLLYAGRVNLYFYVDRKIRTFYIEYEDGGLEKLDFAAREEYRNKLKELCNDCNTMAKINAYVKYNRLSLSRYLSECEKCSGKYFPRLRWGINAGINTARLTIPGDFWQPVNSRNSISPHSSIIVGLYGELPVEMSSFSVITGVNYTRSHFLFKSIFAEYLYDAKIQLAALDFPLMLRYTVPSSKFRPFVNMGGNFTYHIKNSSEIIPHSTMDPDNLNDLPDDPLLAKKRIGFCGGLGLQLEVIHQYALMTEIRYQAFTGNATTFNKSNLALIVGFVF